MGNIQALNSVVDEIFRTMEEIQVLFQDWNVSYHKPFIEKVMHINSLRVRLHDLGYTEDFADTVIKIAYSNVFTSTEKRRYSGN